MEIIVKNFPVHFNRAMGKVILNERQYKNEMKRGGYVSYDEGKAMSAKVSERAGKMNYASMTETGKGLAKAAFELQKRGRGNERPSDRMIDAYKELKKRK